MNEVRLNIDFTFRQLSDAVKQLSLEDKLKLSDIIWEQDDIIIQHKKIVMERMNKIEEKTDSLLNWDEIKNEL